jgi:hypothetical protein
MGSWSSREYQRFLSRYLSIRNERAPVRSEPARIVSTPSALARIRQFDVFPDSHRDMALGAELPSDALPVGDNRAHRAVSGKGTYKSWIVHAGAGLSVAPGPESTSTSTSTFIRCICCIPRSIVECSVCRSPFFLRFGFALLPWLTRQPETWSRSGCARTNPVPFWLADAVFSCLIVVILFGWCAPRGTGTSRGNGSGKGDRHRGGPRRLRKR